MKYIRKTDPNAWPWVAPDEFICRRTLADCMQVSVGTLNALVSSGSFPAPHLQYVGPRPKTSPLFWRLSDVADLFPPSAAEVNLERVYAERIGVIIGSDRKGRRVYGGESVFSGGSSALPYKKAAHTKQPALGWRQVRAKPSIEAIACLDGECYSAESHPALRASI